MVEEVMGSSALMLQCHVAYDEGLNTICSCIKTNPRNVIIMKMAFLAITTLPIQ